jgi:hypothetical protein
MVRDQLKLKLFNRKLSKHQDYELGFYGPENYQKKFVVLNSLWTMFPEYHELVLVQDSFKGKCEMCFKVLRFKVDLKSEAPGGVHRNFSHNYLGINI